MKEMESSMEQNNIKINLTVRKISKIMKMRQCIKIPDLLFWMEHLKE